MPGIAPRVEDEGLLRGTTRFLADVPADDCRHVAFVRSSVAHGELRAVRTGEAAAAPGVVAALTAADLALAPFLAFEALPAAFARPPLATDRVRMVGEPVAVVVAHTPAAAVDAAELVEVDVDPLPPVVTVDEALAPGAPVLFPEAGTNVVMRYDKGRVADLFDGAAHVEVGRFPNQRLASAPMEPTGVIVRPGRDGTLDVWATTQGVHGPRADLARALGLDEAGVRVRSAAVGGGFGGRHSAAIEMVVVAAAARALGVPLRWQETRTENLTTMVHGRAQAHEVEMGFDADGRIVGLRVRNVADCGAYPHLGPLMPFASRKLACGPYRVPRVDYRWEAVATTTNPVGAYRGAGQPEVTNGLERTMDGAARALGLDAVELRRRNLLRADELPWTTPTGLTYESGDYPAALERAARLVGYDDVRAEQVDRRSRADRVQVGVGLACYVSAVDGGSEFGAVDVGTDGSVRLRCGTFSHGQSHATTVGRVVADQLGVAPGAVTYVDGDTDQVPRGHGTGGSRSAQMAGTAALLASRELLARARKVAAELLEADPGDVVVMAGDGDRPAGLGVRGVPTSVVGWARVAQAAGPEGLSAEVDARPEASTFPSGTHAAVVEVDTETGAVRVRRHVAVDDCGTVLDAAVVEGQQHGGSAAGIGQALYEQVAYDPDGNPLTTTFADYLLPTAAELPAFATATMGIPTPYAPNGAKGIGENGAIAAPTAVQNAVVDALAHLGVAHVDLPVSPERAWRAIREAKGARPAPDHLGVGPS